MARLDGHGLAVFSRKAGLQNWTLALFMLTFCAGSLVEIQPVAAKPSTTKTKPRFLTESQALQIVSNRPDVRSWKRRIAPGAKRGTSGHVALDRLENGEYVIQVFEEVPDGDGSAHTATMNWYYVNRKTGHVRKDF